tara:strand:- start:12 stop:176 length:165 start_codon:yes stop_codon:yes gene_type:complete
MKVGDLVRYSKYIGIVTYIDPEELGDPNEVEVTWNDGEVANHSVAFLETVNESW